MKKLLIGIFLLFSLVLTSICPANAQSSATGSITGLVTDSTGKPVPGAKIELRGPAAYTAMTDAKGSFTVSNATPGTYAMSVTRPGYQSISQSGFVITAGESTSVSLSLFATLQTIASIRTTGGGGPHFNTSAAAVNVVTTQTFDNQAQTQVTQVLNQIPGIQISLPGGSTNGAAPGSITVPSIRGASSYETASLIDGHPVAVAAYGDYVTTFLSPFMFGSVEVVKGPGAFAPEVNNAINGTVNFRTKDPTTTPVSDYEFGFTTHGGTYANIGVTDTVLNGRLGFVFDVANNDDPSALDGKRVLIDPSGGTTAQGAYLQGNATYSNIGNTQSNIQTGYSLVACCYTLQSNFNNTSELLKLRYQLSPSTIATVSYLDSQTFTDQNGNVGNYTNAQFLPGSGYSGSLTAGPQQVDYLFPGAPNNGYNLEPIFQAEMSSSIGSDTILARYYHASIYRQTLQGTAPTAQNPDPTDPYLLTLFGTSGSGSTATTYNGLTTPVSFTDYFNETEFDKLSGWSFQYDHPFNQNTLSFSVDQTYTQSQAYESTTSYNSVSIPQGSSQLFTTLQGHVTLQLAPTVSATLADYANIYRSNYATNCPYSGGFSNCSINGNGVTFASTTTSHNDPRFGAVWQPSSNLAVRLAAGSAIAPPYLDLLSQVTAPFASWDQSTGIATLTKNSGQLLPETAFGYDLGSDYRLKDGWTVFSGDIYQNNLFNHYFSEVFPSGLTCGEVSYPCTNQSSQKAPPNTPVYYALNTNISNFRFQGIELQLQRMPPVGWGFDLSGALQRGYVYDLPPYFYCSNPGRGCQYNQNLNIISGQNLNGEGIGISSSIGSLNVRVPYAQGNASVSYTFKNHAYALFGMTYYGNNNSYNEPPFGIGYFTLRYPFTRAVALQVSGTNIFNAWPSVIPIYGSGIGIPLANGGTAATLGNVVGPATYTFVITTGGGGPAPVATPIPPPNP